MNVLNSHFLLTLSLIPLVGTIIIFFIPNSYSKLLKFVGLNFAFINFILSLFLGVQFDNSTAKFQFVDQLTWIPIFNVNYFLGIDGISLFFILLTTFLIPICILVGWDNIQKHLKEYIISLLVLETLLINAFCACDLLIFYIFFESVLIPMFIIIGVWGARERKIHAAYQFFLYTLFGSVFMLLAIMFIYFEAGSTNYQVLLSTSFSPRRQIILWLAFFASFAIKVPMVPVHIWLPEAHVEAPTAGSVILAGILLKLGTYGLLRFSIPMFPDATIFFTPLVYTISIIGIVYTSLTTLRQIDLKKIIAYSSVGHMAFVMIGLFAANIQGIEGSILLMISHGLVSSALFLCVGVLYDRYHTRIINYYGGLAHCMPLFAVLFLFFTLANISIPGTSSFVAEFLVLTGAFLSNRSVAILASTGVILGAAYSIWLYNRVVFGALKNSNIYNYLDISRREFFILLPFILLILLMGIAPTLFLDSLHVSVSNVIQHMIFSLSN